MKVKCLLIGVAVLFVAGILTAPSSVHAYVYFVEAENFDPDRSILIAAGNGSWNEVADKDASNKKYMQYTSMARDVAANGLLYPIPNVGSTTGQWKVWVRCIMPDDGSDSYFFYFSTDGGATWGPQQIVDDGGAGVWPQWTWGGWAPNVPFKKGSGNVLKITGREAGKADVICVRDDGIIPTDEECAKWLNDHKGGKIAVAESPYYRLATTWGNVKAR